MAVSYRFAICNELFRDVPFADVCERVSTAGYSGLEIAPFTLGEDATTLTGGERRELRRQMESADIEFVGFHWLLAGPRGLHATTADDKVRRHTWNYVRSLIDLAADLAGKADRDIVMVLGSPKQRSTVNGMAPDEAVRILKHELAAIAPHAQNHNVKILVEALSPDQTDVVTTLAEAVEMVEQIGSPAIQAMFDVHNARGEREPHTDLIRRFAPFIRHVHVNERDGREPGTGDYNFRELLSTLAAIDYAGWVSLEIFDFSRDPMEIARAAHHYLTGALPNHVLSQAI